MLTTLTHTQQLKNALATAPEEFQLIIIELFKMRKSQTLLKKILKMIQITNKEKLNETLEQYANGCFLNITLLTQSASFQEHILCNVDNDVFEIYEIFSACLLNLHLLAMQTDDFELANKVQQAHIAQSKIMQDDCIIGDDDLTIAWRFYADEFFNKTIQQQLQQYSPQK